jgi:hypothetical protein
MAINENKISCCSGSIALPSLLNPQITLERIPIIITGNPSIKLAVIVAVEPVPEHLPVL